MGETLLKATPVLGGLDLDIGGNRIVERADLALVSIAVPLGGDARFELFKMPPPGRSVVQGDMRTVWMAPNQVMLIFPWATPDAEVHVQGKLKGVGYTTDQTGGWMVLEVSGPDTLGALERICPVNLDPSVFPVDAAARTIMEHLGALIIRLGDERFLLAAASSSAASFAHAVETSFRYAS